MDQVLDVGENLAGKRNQVVVGQVHFLQALHVREGVLLNARNFTVA